MAELDHIVFACTDLETGTEWMTDRLGAPPAGGGAHVLFGTRNRLWSLGEAYLELIAIDPAAPPLRPRFFALDRPDMQAGLADGPRLVHWVLRCDDLQTTRNRVAADPGQAVHMGRDGLNWFLTVRADGTMAAGGLFPSLLHWPDGVTPPARALPGQGLALDRLEVSGDEHLTGDLERIVDDPMVTISGGAPGLAVTIIRADGAVFSAQT